MWVGKKHREGYGEYPEQVIRKHALRRLANVFQVPEASLSIDDRFGEELKTAPATDFRSNEFDRLDDDIKWVADKLLLQAMARGNLVIRTVGDYCDHMVRCSQFNNTKVAEILELAASIGQSTDPGR